MWEEHPAHQKAQAAGVGVGLLLWFVVLVAYSVRNADWALLRFCVAIATFLAGGVGVFWAGTKLLRRIRGRRSGPALAAPSDARR